MLNLDAVSNAKIFDFPFQWGIADRLLPVDEQTIQMCDDFPVDSFRYQRYLNGHYLRRLLIPLGERSAFRGEEMTDAYHQLVKALNSTRYRDALSTVTGINLDQSPMEAAMWRSDANTVFAMHDDVHQKLLTHVIYLNHGWSKRDGGILQILASQNEDDVVFEVVPRLGISTLIARSDSSWHNITPISRSAPDSRNTITVHFYRSGTTKKDLPPR